jgi:hypothetical protein
VFATRSTVSWWHGKSATRTQTIPKAARPSYQQKTFAPLEGLLQSIQLEPGNDPQGRIPPVLYFRQPGWAPSAALVKKMGLAANFRHRPYRQVTTHSGRAMSAMSLPKAVIRTPDCANCRRPGCRLDSPSRHPATASRSSARAGRPSFSSSRTTTAQRTRLAGDSIGCNRVHGGHRC